MLRPADIVVTGLGAVAGAHPNLACLAGGLLSVPAPARALPVPVTRPEAVHPQGFPLFALPDDTAAALTPPGGTLSVGMALAAALEALGQAGIPLARASEADGFADFSAAGLSRGRIGVCLGASSGATLDFTDYYSAHKEGRVGDPARLRAVMSHNPAPALARRLGLFTGGHFPGPRIATLTNACASGTDAIGLAAAWLRAGICDMVLAGGTDELCQTAITGFSRLMVVDPQPCKPFDRDRNGLNLGEGAAVLILERADSAQKRGVTPLAKLGGYGTAADAHHLTAPHPEGRGLQEALRAALGEAGLSPGDLAFINAHGTGTQENDKTEAFVFRTCFPGIPVSATKGATGHTLGAAGAIEAAITVAGLLAGLVPAGPGFTAPHPDLGITPVTTPQPLTTGHALSQSLAFGGNNSAVVFSRVDA